MAKVKKFKYKTEGLNRKKQREIRRKPLPTELMKNSLEEYIYKTASPLEIKMYELGKKDGLK